MIDKSGANQAGLLSVKILRFFHGIWSLIEILQVEYLNNIAEPDHQPIKKISQSTKGFKASYSTAATLQRIEVAHMIRNKQFAQTDLSPFQLFAYATPMSVANGDLFALRK